VNGFSVPEAKVPIRFRKKDVYAHHAKSTRIISFQATISVTKDRQSNRWLSKCHVFCSLHAHLTKLFNPLRVTPFCGSKMSKPQKGEEEKKKKYYYYKKKEKKANS
jgi:hypothetical protein